MKVLFSTLHFGSLRNFEPVLRALAARGHRIHLAADRRDTLGGERAIEGLERDYPGAFTSELVSAEKDRLWYHYSLAIRGSIDYLRYLDPRYGHAVKLRDRAAEHAAWPVRQIGRFPPGIGHGSARATGGFLRVLERVIPPRRRVGVLLDRERPDVLLLTPLLYLGCQQVDYVRAARIRGIPCLLGVGSWDHLTTKGALHEAPDAVVVWNDAQKQEAIDLHGVSPSRIVVTGAQAYDHWFTRKPTLGREEFFARIGLDPRRPMVLYLCSSAFIAPHEVGFVRRWLSAIRSSECEDIRTLGVLIRPHPQNAEQWASVSLDDQPGTAIWPRAGANPIDELSRADYFHSMYYSVAVVGVNTSAQIESSILGRPVLTVLAPEFALTQEGTLHFQHLNAGLLQTASSLEMHVRQLEAVLQRPRETAERSRAFVRTFVRPHGTDVPATDVFVECIERMALGTRPPPGAPPVRDRIVRAASTPLAAVSWLLKEGVWRRRTAARKATAVGAQVRQKGTR